MKYKNKNLILLSALTVFGLGSVTLSAQESSNMGRDNSSQNQNYTRESTSTSVGAQAGDWELTLGGSGSNDRDFHDGGFGISGSLGYYATDALEYSIRQSINYADFGNSQLNGATRVAADYHFLTDTFRPFIGANFGMVYGDSVNESLAAGLETGAKWYVKSKTFIFAMAEYQWLFDDADDADDTFDSGQFLYSVGIGFNF